MFMYNCLGSIVFRYEWGYKVGYYYGDNDDNDDSNFKAYMI